MTPLHLLKFDFMHLPYFHAIHSFIETIYILALYVNQKFHLPSCQTCIFFFFYYYYFFFFSYKTTKND